MLEFTLESYEKLAGERRPRKSDLDRLESILKRTYPVVLRNVILDRTEALRCWPRVVAVFDSQKSRGWDADQAVAGFFLTRRWSRQKKV